LISFNYTYSFIFYRCKDNFDFSDHVVFYIIHFQLVLALELSYIIENIRKSTEPLRLMYLRYNPSIILIIIYFVFIMKNINITIIYFHTRLEVFIGYIISIPLFLAICDFENNKSFLKKLGLLPTYHTYQ
jgi:hypothetical protein